MHGVLPVTRMSRLVLVAVPSGRVLRTYPSLAGWVGFQEQVTVSGPVSSRSEFKCRVFNLVFLVSKVSKFLEESERKSPTTHAPPDLIATTKNWKLWEPWHNRFFFNVIREVALETEPETLKETLNKDEIAAGGACAYLVNEHTGPDTTHSNTSPAGGACRRR